MTVYELSREQLDELKDSMLYMEYYDDFPMPEEVKNAKWADDIPDYVVFREYEDYDFSDDDFLCSFYDPMMERMTAALERLA